MTELRISIVGNSGTGKSTAAARIQQALDLPHLELDGVYHQPDWQPLEDREFQSRVTAFMDANPSWIIDGNYAPVRDLVWEQATTVIWLDPPRWRTMVQIGWRTLRRGVLRQELWNGNRERLANFLSLDPEESVLAWAWVKHPWYRDEYTRRLEDSRWSHIDPHRFTNHRQFEQWLCTIQTAKASASDEGRPTPEPRL